MDYGMDYQGGGGGFGAPSYSGGGAGGGATSGGGGGYPATSQSQPPSSGGRARRSYDEQSLIPVTIRMIQAARPEGGSAGGDPSSGSLELEDGRKLSRVKLVAATRSVEDMSTNVMYSVEDGTGLIDVKLWLDDNACTALTELRQPTLRDNAYLKIVGTVKFYDNVKMVVADSVQPLRTSNELTHHLLEVVHSAEKARRKTTYIPPAQGGAVGTAWSGVGFGGSAPSSKAMGAPLQARGGGGAGPGSLVEQVGQYIRDHGKAHPDRGTNVETCIADLTRSGRFTEADVRRALDDLSSEGHIYSTVDENHYQYAG